MAFLRPNELTKVTLHGMWTHCFTHTHERARALHLRRWNLSIAFGEKVFTARGLCTVGAMTKVSRRGQKFDADGRGSDVVIEVRSENGLVPGRIVDAILQLRGVPLGTVGKSGSRSNSGLHRGKRAAFVCSCAVDLPL
jgi:hypothetical protein